MLYTDIAKLGLNALKITDANNSINLELPAHQFDGRHQELPVKQTQSHTAHIYSITHIYHADNVLTIDMTIS